MITLNRFLFPLSITVIASEVHLKTSPSSESEVSDGLLMLLDTFFIDVRIVLPVKACQYGRVAREKE